MWSRIWFIHALCGLAISLAACDGDQADTAQQDGELSGCMPGHPAACQCADGTLRTPICPANGIVGACPCNDAPANNAAAGAPGAQAGMSASPSGMMPAAPGIPEPAPVAGTGAPAAGTAGANGQAGASGAAGAAGAAGMQAAAGANAAAGASAAAGSPAMPEPAGDWPAADPAAAGPFQTTTETNVGPGSAFTMFRPSELTRRHPVITWGNGTGTMPPTYRALLTQYASHGFIVIASNSENVGRGDPPPMLAGVTWVLEQDMQPDSALFEHVDREHIGATGHSQGAFATSAAAADERIVASAPLQGARATGLHGPSILICGSGDTIVSCSGSERAFNSINSVPVMYAELMGTDHTNWIFGGFGGGMHPYYVVTTAWFRLHLMGDESLRSMFYGPSCELCQDSQWVIMQKMMD